MTQRLSKLAEYLYSDSYEMAVQLHQRADRRSVDQPQQVQLLLAKAYFATQNFTGAAQMAAKLKSTRNPKVAYEAHFLQYKALYLNGTHRPDILESLRAKLTQTAPQNLTKYCKQIEETLSVAGQTGRGESGGTSQMARSGIGRSERREFEELLKTEDDNSVVMEGMPMFLVAQRWYESWQDYTSPGQKFQKEKQHPGPITQFQLVDHLYNVFIDPQSHKDYTNRYIFANAGYKLLPKKCWIFLKQRYGGIQVKRYNISFLDKPYEIITEVNLKRVEVARADREGQLNFVFVQITKKENWEGLKAKLGGLWGTGKICLYDGKGNRPVTETETFQQIDTLGKKYVFVVGKEPTNGKEAPRVEKCGNKKCNKTADLKSCQCKTIKYCNMECLKEDWKYHKAKCELEMQHLRRRPVTFKQFNLQQKDYGGRRGVVGLKNLGNTCYMNAGLQCLSNTREITDYFMKDDFKSHINHSNPLGTKGNIACSYAELIRQMWTGNSESVAPVKLKKKIGDFATQFSGYGQQDSQELISYLIDGLQEDLNLVKKKENFQAGQEIKPDEEMSRESEYNFSRRIQSYIRNLMVGQFKSTVVCSVCQKVSVCFDPFMLISLPIPTNKQWAFYFISSSLDKGALKINCQFASTTTFRSIAKQFSKTYNENYYKEIRDNLREKASEDRIMVVTLNSETFTITRVLPPDDLVSPVFSNDILIFLQIPKTDAGEELLLCEYEQTGVTGVNGDRCSYPRLLKLPRGCTPASKDAVIYKSIERGLEKGTPKTNYAELVAKERINNVAGVGVKVVVVELRRKIKLATFVEGYNQGFGRRLVESEDTPLNLEDCFRAFTNREKLQKENSWFCNKCKEFKEAIKQMEIYKANRVMVLAFKRFNRNSKINTAIKYPVEGFDMGPFLLSNKSKEPVLYDLYGIVNHHGSLYGGHYTAYCQNFLNKRWYEFNDSRVSQINKSEVVTGYAYVLFYRRRQK